MPDHVDKPEVEKLCQSIDESRRNFLKKAIIGSVFAAPVIESFTRSGIIVKAAMAQTAQTQAFIITGSSTPGGTIDPSGQTNVPQGGNRQYTFTPDPGYVVDNVVVDGQSQGSIPSYTFDDVNANHTISVSFTPRQSYPEDNLPGFGSHSYGVDNFRINGNEPPGEP
jgi:hypothetical protein